MGYNRAIRQHVINIALNQAYEGAHYMWGSRGGTPNGNTVSTKFNRKDPNPATVSFCAAFTDRDRGTQVCGGRWAQKAKAVVKKGPEGFTNPTAASDPILAKWLAKNAHYNETDWDDTLTPRLTKGVGVTTEIVWGEGCDGTRHFDCISFINWCLGKGVYGKYTYDMNQYFYSIEPKQGVVSAEDVTDEDPKKALPGDILLYGTLVKPATQYFQEEIAKERAVGDTKGADDDQTDLDVIKGSSAHNFIVRHGVPCVPKFGVGVGVHHIGFATGDGDSGRVHASDNSNGVIADKWGSPIRRIRLPDSMFK